MRKICKILTWRKLTREPRSTIMLLSPMINRTLPDLQIWIFPSIPPFKLPKVQYSDFVDSLSGDVCFSLWRFARGSVESSDAGSPGRQSGNWKKKMLIKFVHFSHFSSNTENQISLLSNVSIWVKNFCLILQNWKLIHVCQKIANWCLREHFEKSKSNLNILIWSWTYLD